MHVTIKDPQTGDYIEVCIPQYGSYALVLRRTVEWDALLFNQARTIARALGARRIMDASSPDDISEDPDFVRVRGELL
jgi:hypothetical protein